MLETRNSKEIFDLNLAIQYSYSLDFLRKLVTMFLENQKNILEELDNSFIVDKDTFHLKVHTLKGISKNIGSVALNKIAILMLDDLNNKALLEELKIIIVLLFDKLNEFLIN